MSTALSKIEFENLGIGKALSQFRLQVPVNQREYSWDEEQVQDLFEDLHRAVGEGSYFLGTIVLTQAEGGVLEVADGQQRLATTMILLAAIRDFFFRKKDSLNVESIDNEFLTVIDRTVRRRIPRLSLNVDDNSFFNETVVTKPDEKGKQPLALRDSHRRILTAKKLAAQHVTDLTRNRSDAGQTETLLKWLEFLNHGAQVIALTVPDHLNAFRMFETLNDRGLKTSQSDLLKNYLFGEAGSARIGEAQHKWSAMTGTLEAASVGDDITVTYLRHFLVAKNGATREREVYDKIKATVTGPFAAIEILDDLAENAMGYVALLNHRSDHWNSYEKYSGKLRKHIETLNELRVEQIRPLMLACMKSFSKKDLETAYRAFIWWAVRFMVVGAPTGTVEKYYARRAAEIWRGEISNAAALIKAMASVVPDDTTFRNQMETLRVSKTYWARYLLRSLENAIKKDPEPEHVVNDDASVLTLEHILPQNPSDAWPGLDAETAETAYRRLGNMMLLRATANSTAGNGSFVEKKKLYKASTALELAKQVMAYDQWGVAEITERQKSLAQIALTTWPRG